MRTIHDHAQAAMIVAAAAVANFGDKIEQPEPFHQPWQKKHKSRAYGSTKGTIAQRKAKRERRKNSR